MAEVVAKRDTPSSLRLKNGDQVMISVATSSVNVLGLAVAVMGKGAQVEVGGHGPSSDIMELIKHCRN